MESDGAHEYIGFISINYTENEPQFPIESFTKSRIYFE